MCVILTFLVGLMVPPLDDAKPSVKQQYDALLKEYESAIDSWQKEFDRFGVEENKASVLHLQRRFLAWPAFSFAPKFVEFAEKNPGDPASFDALAKVVAEMGMQINSFDRDLRAPHRRSLELLARDYLADPRIETVVRSLRGYRGPAAEAFLRLVLEKSGDRRVKAIACVNLAGALAGKQALGLGRWFDDPKASPHTKFVSGRLDREVLQQIRSADGNALRAEAEALNQRAIAEFGDLEFREGSPKLTVANVARIQLNDLRVVVGAVAPEVVGQDLDGRPMKLSEFRGKVVVLSFWGSWCGPCVAVIPRERKLVERMSGKPFVLLGVDSDEKVESAKKVVEREKMTWRSWKDGFLDGPITEQWGIRGWPTLFVIDAKGVIRHKGGCDERLEAKVDELVAELKQ